MQTSTPSYEGPAVLHVGYIKTASTYLQNAVFASEELGFGLPGGDGSRAHLIEWFVAGDPYRFDPAAVSAEMARLERPLRDRGLVPVWSEETLLGNPLTRSYHGAAVAQKIQAVGRPFKVIISVREQRSFCLSAYAEYLKRGRNPLVDFIGTGKEEMSFRPILQPEFLMYERAALRWQELAGPGNLLVIPFEMLAADPEGYARRLQEFLQLPAAPQMPKGRPNTSAGGAALAVARFLNAFGTTSPLRPGFSPTQRVIRKALRLFDRISPPAFDAAVTNRWRRQIHARYEGMFAENNRRLAELSGCDLERYGYQMPVTGE